MQKVNAIEKLQQVLPPVGQTRFHTLNYERGVRDALQFVLDKKMLSRESKSLRILPILKPSSTANSPSRNSLLSMSFQRKGWQVSVFPP